LEVAVEIELTVLDCRAVIMHRNEPF